MIVNTVTPQSVLFIYTQACLLREMSFYGIRYNRISDDLVNIGAGQSCVVDVLMYATCSRGAWCLVSSLKVTA